VLFRSVGSFKKPKLAIIDASTRKLRKYSPTIGVGVSDMAYGLGSLWIAVSREHAVWKLNAKTGRPQKKLPLDGSPGVIAVTKDAVWVDLVNNGTPDMLVKLDPKTGQTLTSVPYPYGVSSIAVSPSALWVVSRRRARTYRADPETGRRVHELRIGSSRAEDAVYGNGALWVAVPNDDTVYKVLTASGQQIPISVGKHPRQVALDGGTVYVSDNFSSDLLEIDAKTSRVVGTPVSLPVNPYAIATTKDAVWVTSQPDNVVSMLTRGPAG